MNRIDKTFKNLDDKLVRQFIIKCKREGRTQGGVLNSLINEWVRK